VRPRNAPLLDTLAIIVDRTWTFPITLLVKMADNKKSFHPSESTVERAKEEIAHEVEDDDEFEDALGDSGRAVHYPCRACV
jgi:hypothetical protein